jgi:hypothetical protein
MATRSTQPPWEFLLSASRNSLQSFELSRLAHASNLRKEITALIDQWMEESAAAMLARWLLEQQNAPPGRRTCFPPAICATRARIPCPIIFLRIEPLRSP